MRVKKRSKANRWIFMSILILAAVGVYAAYLMKPVPTDYESVNARIGDITTYYSFSGNVEAKNRQIVISEKVIPISKVSVKEGMMVKEGDVLIEIKNGGKIRSKIDGEIVKLNVKDKDQVNAGKQMMEIIDFNNLKISLKVDEYDIIALSEGKEVDVKIGAINKEIKTEIKKISKEGQIVNDVTFFVATLDIASEGNIKIGMSAEVKLIHDQVNDVVTLPITVLQFDNNNQPYVFKDDGNDKVIKAEIVTGINDGRTVEIKNGVLDGEKVFYPKSAPRGIRLLGVF